MTIYDIPVNTLSGEASSLANFEGETILIVNVASKCGLTPAVRGTRGTAKEVRARGFSVVGFPCNQFAGQEPGTAEEIQTFCSTTYGVTFPLFEKIDVNGENQSPVYAELEQVADARVTPATFAGTSRSFWSAKDGSSAVSRPR